jgi:aspartate 1-decarboxylase
MLRRFLKAKIRDLKLTGAKLEYEGSIALDQDWLDESGIAPYEEVQVLNIENGTRLYTYVIPGERGSGITELNGPAARLGYVGDRIMVLSYCLLSGEEVSAHKPVVVSVGNR